MFQIEISIVIINGIYAQLLRELYIIELLLLLFSLLQL
jgi:hypothetical protein